MWASEMGRKRIKKKQAPEKGRARGDLTANLRSVARPAMDVLGADPPVEAMRWVLSVAATAWNASRHPDEVEGLAALDRAADGLVVPLAPEVAQVGAILEEIFYLARVRFPADPRYVARVFVEKRGPSDFYVEAVPGRLRRKER